MSENTTVWERAREAVAHEYDAQGAYSAGAAARRDDPACSSIIEWVSVGIRASAGGWKCFHCDEVFTTEREARDHFGFDPCQDPACRIKLGAERSLLTAIRRAEQDAAEAWQAIHNETTDAAKAYYKASTRHQDQMRAVEELGYERGLRDAHGSEAARDVIGERQRQIEAEGWTPEHDDQHENGEMALAASCYARFAAFSDKGREATEMPEALLIDSGQAIPGWGALCDLWPWTPAWWKPSTRRRDLVKAAALIIAEIERLDRAAAKRSAA